MTGPILLLTGVFFGVFIALNWRNAADYYRAHKTKTLDNRSLVEMVKRERR